VDLDIHTVGDAGDLSDLAGDFLAAHEITDTGAVLVRPDGFVAWRAKGAADDPVDTMTAVLTSVLCLERARGPAAAAH
jgi:hypothetical protein